MTVFESLYNIGDQVMVDGCTSIVFHITAVLWRNECPLYEVSWINDSARTAWIETWRLNHMEE